MCTNSLTTANNSLENKSSPKHFSSEVWSSNPNDTGLLDLQHVSSTRSGRRWRDGQLLILPTNIIVKHYKLSWALFHFDHWAYSSPTLYSPPCFFESCIIWISKLVLPSHCIVPPRWRVSRGSEDDMWAWGTIYRKDLVWNQKISSIPQLFWTV